MEPISNKIKEEAASQMFQYGAIGVMLFFGFMFTTAIVWWVLRNTHAQTTKLTADAVEDKNRILNVLSKKEELMHGDTLRWHDTIRETANATVRVANAVDNLASHVQSCTGQDCPLKKG